MRFSAPPPVNPPVFADDPDALPSGDVVLLPFADGHLFSLRFGGSFEAFLSLDGKRVAGAAAEGSPQERRLSIWVHRHLAALNRILGERYGLVGVVNDTRVQLRDIVELEEDPAQQRFLDHSAVRRVLSGSPLNLPPFAALGEIGSAAELNQRARAMFAAGARVEVRVEDDGHVILRRHLQISR
jgi:hypothetical protein